MKEVITTFGQLSQYIEEFTCQQLENCKEVDISNFGISIPTPNGLQQVNYFIKKENLSGVELTINNKILGCAENHILLSAGCDIFAKDLTIGDSIDTINGPAEITNKTSIKCDDYYDVSINAPHLYYDGDGIIHHNTIMTAALSKSVEKYGRSIVIVPNKSLVTQTEEDYVNLGLDVGVYFGDRKEYNKTHTICTWQSLNNLLKNTKAGEADIPINEFIDNVVCVMVDECFDGETRVLTTHGYVPIKNIKSGDKIINYCEQTEIFKEDTVIKQHHNLTVSSLEKMYELEFDNGSVIKVTGNHKFLTTLGWCRADELTENHEIVNKS
jgi:Pretoxin HINT domain